MLWLKWCGLLMMGAGVSSLGLWMAHRMDRRVIEYRQLQKILMLLSMQMQLGESVEAALEKCLVAGADAWEGWLTGMIPRLRERQPLSNVWQEELQRIKSVLHLEKEDYQMLEHLGSNLQGAQMESCMGLIRQVQEYFRMQQQMLEQVNAEQGRLYRSIGILSGILVVVVLA